MDKEAGAYRTIGEVAAELDLPQHVLRFWETRFPAIRPLKRAGGRRFYRPTDVALLRDIRAKLYDEGYTIKGVQRLLRDRGGKAVVAGETAEACRDAVINDFREEVGGSSPTRAGGGLSRDPLRAAEVAASGTTRETLTNPSGDAIAVAALREALDLVEACERRLRAALAASA